MAQKLMVDSVVTWARDYKVDGFRFDLMGHAAKANMLEVRAALDALTLRRDGVDGVRLPLRRGLELRRGGRQRPVHPGHARATSAAPASAPSATGCVTPCAAAARSTTTRASRASAAASRPTPTAPRSTTARTAAAGPRHRPRRARDGRQPRAFTFRTPGRKVVRGDQVDYNGSARRVRRPARRGRQLRRRPRQRDALRLADVQAAGGDLDGRPGPDEHALARDDRAGPDAVVLARGRRPAAQQVPRPQQLRQRRLVQPRSTGPAPTTASATACRPRRDNVGEVGLHEAAARRPGPQADGGGRGRARARPAQDLLRLRFSHPAVPARVGATAIDAKVCFPARDDRRARRASSSCGSTTRAGGRRPDAEGPRRRLQRLGLRGGAEGARHGRPADLLPVQAGGADAVVKASTWDAGAGSTLSVPARTVAVFVQPS